MAVKRGAATAALAALLWVSVANAASSVELGVISIRAIWPGEVPYSSAVAALFTDCTVAVFKAQNLAANATVALAASVPVTNATVPASSGAFRNPRPRPCSALRMRTLCRSSLL